MANTLRTAVVFLEEHPAWVATQARERQRIEAMRRHPSFVAGQRAATRAGDVAPVVRDLRACPDTSA